MESRKSNPELQGTSAVAEAGRLLPHWEFDLQGKDHSDDGESGLIAASPSPFLGNQYSVTAHVLMDMYTAPIAEESAEVSEDEFDPSSNSKVMAFKPRQPKNKKDKKKR